MLFIRIDFSHSRFLWNFVTFIIFRKTGKFFNIVKLLTEGKITIDYQDAAISVFGLGIHWLIVFFVVSIAFAFALRKPFGVTI